MSGGEPSRPSDLDDWFAESSSDGTAPVEPPAGGDDEPEPGVTVKLRTLLGAAAIVVALIVLAGLALAGAFSGGNKPASSPATEPTTTAQTPSPTPTTAAQPTHRALAAPTTPLKPGDQGAQVKLLQRALKRLGYAAGTADGDYGPTTQDALMRFQEASRLTADGVLGPKTLQALKLALQRSG